MQMRWTILHILLLSGLALFVTKGYLLNGLPGTDDGVWAPVRLGSMVRELRQGQFPVRWSADLNFAYGYPLFHFSYPGTYYLATVFYLLGFGLVDSVKAIFIAGVISCLIGCYQLAKRLTGSSLLGLSAAVLAASSPYLTTNLYRRGSIGEVLAAGLLPWIALAAYSATKNKSLRISAILGLLIALLVTVHNVSALLSLPLIALMIGLAALPATAQAKSISYKLHCLLAQSYRALLGLLLGISASSFFWLPALTDIQVTKISEKPLTYIHEWFVSPQKSLLFPLFNQGPENLSDYRLSIGFIHTILFLIATIVVWRIKTQAGFRVLSVVLLGYIFLLMPISQVVWNNLPLLKSVDFPWRVLTVLSVAIPIYVVSIPWNRIGRAFIVCAAIITILIAAPWYRQRDLVVQPDTAYATNQATATSNNEYITTWMPSAPQQQPQEKIITRYGIAQEMSKISETPTKREWRLVMLTAGTIEYALMYFPGWKVYLNQKPVEFTYQANGLVQIPVPEGESVLELRFEKTPVVLISELVSAISVLILALIIVRYTIRSEV